MKTLLYLNKIQYWLLIIIAFTIPLPKMVAVNSIGIILLFISVIVNIIITKKKDFTFNKSTIILLFIFIPFFFSGLWSEDKKIFLFEIEKKLSLFFFPLIFSSITLTNSHLNGVLKSWIAGTSLLLLICLYNLIRNYFNVELHSYYPDYYLGEGLVFQIKMHRVYVAIHCMFTIIILFITPLFSKHIRYILGSIFLVFVVMLSARIILAVIPIIIFVYIVYLLYKKELSLKLLLPLLTTLLVLIFFLVFVPKVKFMFKQILITEQYSDVKNVNAANGVHVRYLIWKAAKNAIFISPTIGYGIGDSQKALNQQYDEMGFELAQKNPYNAHNQYIQVALDAGLLGLIFFIGILAYLLFFAIKFDNRLYLLFLLLIVFCFLSENLLSNQKGVVFFSLFNSLLFFNTSKIKFTNI